MYVYVYNDKQLNYNLNSVKSLVKSWSKSSNVFIKVTKTRIKALKLNLITSNQIKSPRPAGRQREGEADFRPRRRNDG